MESSKWPGTVTTARARDARARERGDAELPTRQPNLLDRLVCELGQSRASKFLQVCAQMRKGRSIRSITSGPGRPCCEDTFYTWKNVSRAASEMYARARMDRADVLFDQLIEDVEAEPNPQKAKVMFEARRWAIGKMNRGLYGDDPPSAPVAVSVNVDNGALVLEEIKRRLEKKARALAKSARTTDPVASIDPPNSNQGQMPTAQSNG